MGRYHAKYRGGEKIYEEQDGEVLIDKRERHNEAGYYVMPDIQPYTSMIDGSTIHSRSQHRSHLRANGCVEVGNDISFEKKRSYTEDKKRKEAIAREVYNRFK